MILLDSMIASGVGSNSRFGYMAPSCVRSLTAQPPLVPAPATRPMVPPRAGSQRSTMRVEYGIPHGSAVGAGDCGGARRRVAAGTGNAHAATASTAMATYTYRGLHAGVGSN